MILLLAGTTEAKAVLNYFAEKQPQVLKSVIVSTAYDFAKQFLENYSEIFHISGAMDSHAMVNLIKDRNIKVLIDATHPFATNVSKNAIKACEETKIPYLRVERQYTAKDDYKKIFYVDSFDDAAKLANSLGDIIFLAIGSNNAESFKRSLSSINNKRDETEDILLMNTTANQKKIYIRVLPNEKSIKKCKDAGFDDSEIITGTGPFSFNDNYEKFKNLDVEVVVTKESGIEGGLAEKINAAKALNIPIIVIKRPKLQASHNSKSLKLYTPEQAAEEALKIIK